MFRFDKAFREEFKSNWLLLAIAVTCLLFGLGASAFSLPFLFPEVISEFGWSREEATLIASTKYIFAALGAVFFGLMIDKVGMWLSLFLSMILAGSGLVSLIWVSSLPMYYLSGAIMGIASAGGVISVKILVSRSFHASQGTAMGIALMGPAIGATMVPIVISFLISKLGWRYGFAAMSLAVWFVAIPLLAFGYFAKGAVVTAQAAQVVKGAATALGQDHLVDRVRDVLQRKNFWVIVSAVFIASVVDAGFTQHQVLILKDFGFSTAKLTAVVSLIGLASVGSRVFVGNVLDSASNKGLACLYLTLFAACIAVPFLTVPVIVFLFVIFRAVGHAANLLDTTVMTKHAFGNTKNLGTLLGFMTASSASAWAVGPWLMGRIFDVTGSYDLAYVIFAGLSLVAVMLALNIKPAYWLELNLKSKN